MHVRVHWPWSVVQHPTLGMFRSECAKVRFPGRFTDGVLGEGGVGLDREQRGDVDDEQAVFL